MRELRTIALSEDGDHLVLSDSVNGSEGERFRLAVDDKLRAALRAGARRPPEPKQESALSPREIQARLRAGQSAAEVASAAGIPVERVERYEGPVLAERARVVEEARGALLPTSPGASPGRPLGEVVDGRLTDSDDDPAAAQWDAWRRPDGIWLVQLTSDSRCARWTWDPVVRRVRPHDEAARALVAPEPPADATPPAPAPAAPPIPAPSAPAGGQQVRSAPALTLVAEPLAPAPAPQPVHQAPAAPPARPAAARPPTPAAPAPAPAATPPAAPEPAAEPARPARPAAQAPAAATAAAGKQTKQRAGRAGAVAAAAPADETPPSTPRPAGRRGRKSVPAWDDIVFGARRP